MANYCNDCGCKVYRGHCVNCHEEVFIAEQYYEDGGGEWSQEFADKVKNQLENPQPLPRNSPQSSI